MVVGCLRFSEDGVVTGPEWSQEGMTFLIREMRKAQPAPGISDLLVLARIFHELFEEKPETRTWPLFSRQGEDKSLLREIVSLTPWAEVHALYRAEEENYHMAANLARWVLRLPQQPHPMVVFVEDLPPDPPLPIQRRCGSLKAPLRLAAG